jgi:hypothetical protein
MIRSKPNLPLSYRFKKMSLLSALYAIAIFLASGLLFLVEPMAGKQLSPLLGGSAAVWVTCLVFFQTALLLGYLCAHWLATRIKSRAQGPIYIALLIAGVLASSLTITSGLHADTGHPILSVFRLLTKLIGLPFILLSATSPLLQAWYARTQARASNQLAP